MNTTGRRNFTAQSEMLRKLQAQKPTTFWSAQFVPKWQPRGVTSSGIILMLVEMTKRTSNITTGPIPFRKACIKSVVDRIEVDDDAIRIIGGSRQPWSK
jgi:hypothetical protein